MKGTVIGQYRVTGLLGRGGMGMVYEAEHTLLGRSAAVKVLLPDLSSKQEVVQRFFNEARAATAIRHPGIVEIYDFGWTNDGAAFIVMELLEGESLRARRTRGKLSWGAALGVTRQIAGALGAAHAKGIVHRDLKPDNVYVVPDPEVPGGERIKLLDFGIAKLADSAQGQHRTRTGAVIGTPSYMAPEQCRGVAIDSRADLYSLGCILFELCTGRPPFVGEGEGDVLAAHIHVPPPTVGSLATSVPKEIEALVQRMLAKAPADRVQTAEEVIRLIDAAGATFSGPRAVTAFPFESSTGGAVAFPREPSAAAPAHPSIPSGTIYSETTLSSAAATNNLAAPRASRRRLALIAAVGGAAGLGIVAAIAIGGGSDGGTPATRTASTQPVGSVSPDAEAPPQPPPATPPSPSSTAASASPPPASTSPSSPSTSPPPASTLPQALPADSTLPADSPTPPPVAAKTPPRPEGPSTSPPNSTKGSSPTKVVTRPRPEPAEKWEPATVDVTISSTPPGAEVVQSGKVLGKTPLRVPMVRKDRDVRLVLRLAGHGDKAITVNTAAPSKQSVQLAPVAHNKVVNPFD